MNKQELLEKYPRFWSKMIEKENGCWEWQAAKDRAGYGVFRTHGKTVKAHRWAFRHARNKNITNLHVLHKCDNPPCCNPAHLYAGTHQDNMRDMYSRNRRKPAVGEKASHAKLTKEQVLEIRSLKGTASSRTIGSQFGVSHANIQAIWRGETWRHINDTH